MKKPSPQKVRLSPRTMQTMSAAELQGLADDVARLGDAHDMHDEALQAIPRLPERKLAAGVFSSAASGVTSVTMMNPLSKKPEHLTLTLRRDDAADFAAVWSWWWVFSGDSVMLKFIGLPASVRCRYTVEFSREEST